MPAIAHIIAPDPKLAIFNTKLPYFCIPAATFSCPSQPTSHFFSSHFHIFRSFCPKLTLFRPSNRTISFFFPLSQPGIAQLQVFLGLASLTLSLYLDFSGEKRLKQALFVPFSSFCAVAAPRAQGPPRAPIGPTHSPWPRPLAEGGRGTQIIAIQSYAWGRGYANK